MPLPLGAVRADGERGETGRRLARPAVGHGDGLAVPRTLPGARRLSNGEARGEGKP